MQQRRLRLGDILDDYCPRERRVTNHAVVAMIEDDVRQTRCTTCDTEHEYKRAKLPTLRRKKDTVSQAYKDVLATVTTDSTMQSAQAAAPGDDPVAPAQEAPPSEPPVQTMVAAADREAEPADTAPGADEGESQPPEGGSAPGEDGGGRVHRRLIRATLPRVDNQQVQRPVPEFTMRQPQGRAGKFRARGPANARAAAAAGRGAGFGNTARGGGGRVTGGRIPGSRNDFHRPPRGPQAQRRDKKHSK